MSAPIVADLSVLGASETYSWLLARTRVGAHTVAARWVLAALKDPDDHLAHHDAVEWLVDEACGPGDNAKHARALLREVAHPTQEHGILMDHDVARRAARDLKGRGHIGVRVVPLASGGFLLRSQGVTFDSLAGVA